MNPNVLVVALAAAVLYELGRRRLGGGRSRRDRGWRAEAFYAGLAALIVATQPPLDGLADRSFSAHMVQHLLLLTVAPPLLVLGAPWLPLWRTLPSRGRRRLGRWLACSRGAVPLHLLARTLGRPPVAWLLFVGAIALSHLPAIFDLALAILQARSPLYAPYAAEGHRPGGLTALADQQLGGAVMLEPASLPLLVALIWSVKRWLDAAQPSAAAGSSR